MHRVKRLVLAIAVTVAAVPSAAQVGGGYDGEAFVKAVREGNAPEALRLLKDKPSLLDARDVSGNTALLGGIEERQWELTAYLLREGANPNLASRDGETPLIAASRAGFGDAVEWLISVGAKVDEANRKGETPLIIAVQRRQVPIVRILLNNGANPDKADSAAGYSARDYARRDSRSPELLRLIEAKKPTR